MRPVFDLGRESRTIVLLAAYLGVGLGLYALSGWLTRQFAALVRGCGQAYALQTVEPVGGE